MTIDEFQKADLRVGKVIAAECVEGSEKLLKLQVVIGPRAVDVSVAIPPETEGSGVAVDSAATNDVRQILSGIAKTYAPEAMVGREVVIIANLEPRMMMGMESQGMILAAHGGNGEPVLLAVEREVPPGSKVS